MYTKLLQKTRVLSFTDYWQYFSCCCFLGVNKFAGTTIFDASGKKKSNTLRYIMQPLLISVVVIATILIILLFIASWDRNERRIRSKKPKHNQHFPTVFSKPSMSTLKTYKGYP